MRTIHPARRRGAVLPLFALALVALIGFLALAIDIGIIAVAETQSQSAADNAALAGARALTGATGGNTSNATTTAQQAAAINPIMSQTLTSSQVAVQHGAYHYDYSSLTFTPQFPPVAPDTYNLTQVTVTPNVSSYFARVFGLTAFNIQATATAAYRPRDVAVVLDFSGSMNNETDLWNCESYLGNLVNTPNNTDSVYPQWGVYNPSYSPTATLQCTSTDTRVGNCNISIPVGGVPALVADFYSNSRGGSAAAAFAPASAPPTRRRSATTTSRPARTLPPLPVDRSPRSAATTRLTNGANKSFVSAGYAYYTGAGL